MGPESTPTGRQAQASFSIKKARTEADYKDALTLINAYISWLDIDLTFQNITSELAAMQTLYAPPVGDILLAKDDNTNKAIGIVCLRACTKIGPNCCEMKRLYVLPEGQNLGVGKALVEQSLTIAQELGYTRIVLDTLRRMESAIRLYRRFGFQEMDAYYLNPDPGAMYMTLELG